MTLRQRTFSAGRWTTASALSRSALQVIQIAIVARFLMPSDFGLMAIAVALLAVLGLIADFGIGRAIIHFNYIEPRALSSLYWLNVGFAGLLSSCIAIIAPFIATLYGQPTLTPVLLLISPILLITSLSQQFCVMAEKDLRFAILAQNEVLSTFIGLCVCIIAAVWMHAGVYALIAATLATACTNSLLAWRRLSYGHRPTFHFRLKETLPFLRFGGYLVGENAASTVARQVDVFVGGWFVSSAGLGIYSLPRDLSLRLAMMVNQIVTRVGFPVMSRIRDDPAMLKAVYLQTLRMTSSVNFPIYVALGFFANELIALLYGPRWSDAVNLLRIFAVWGLLRSIANPSGSLLYAAGKVRRAFGWNVAQLLILPIFYWIGAGIAGTSGLAIALVLAQLLLLLPTWRFIVFPCCGATFVEYFRQLFPPLIASILAGTLAWGLTRSLDHGTLRLAMGSILGAATYVGLSAAINRTWLAAMSDLLMPILKRRT